MKTRSIPLLIAALSIAAFGRASVLDKLGPARVFACRAKKVMVEGSFEVSRQSDTLWADRILSGLEPNRYDYFIVRPSSRAETSSAFDFVFFCGDGRGIYVGIPTALVRSLTDTEVIFAFALHGGGEAGVVKTRRTISIKLGSEPDELVGIISEESATSSVWSGRKKEVGEAILEFRAVRLPQDIVDAAMKSPNANAKNG